MVMLYSQHANFQSQEKLMIDGMIGRFKTGEQSGNPLIFQLSNVMKNLKSHSIQHGVHQKIFVEQLETNILMYQ